MSLDRAAYPSDVSDEEWALVAPYLALLREDSKQRDHDLREVFNGLRYIVKTGAPWRFLPHDLPPWAAVYQQGQRWLAAEGFTDAAGDPGAALRVGRAGLFALAGGAGGRGGSRGARPEAAPECAWGRRPPAQWGGAAARARR